MKKCFIYMLVLAILLNITGCETIKKKFRRKKKTVKAPRIHQLKKYQKKPTPGLYKKHFVYWASWNSDLVRLLGQNHKKDIRCSEEIVSNLRDMQAILIPEMADKMEPHIAKLEDVKETILRGDISPGNKYSIKRTLEKEERIIRREFTYKKVKSYMKKSFDEEFAPEDVITEDVVVKEAGNEAKKY